MEDKFYRVTKEKVQNAEAYMPEAFREELSESIAKQCLKEIPIETEVPLAITLPPMRGENVALKSMHLTLTLLTFYFKEEIDGEKFSENYDFYAGGHILNQLERMKSDGELKEKIFDLLADFKEFKRYVDTKIYDLKTAYNDGVTRFAKGISLITSDPEFIKKMQGEVKKLQEETKSEKA